MLVDAGGRGGRASSTNKVIYICIYIHTHIYIHVLYTKRECAGVVEGVGVARLLAAAHRSAPPDITPPLISRPPSE